MNVLVVGCGSLGGVIAVRLAGRKGLRLEGLNRNPRIAEAASGQGLRLRAVGGRGEERVAPASVLWGASMTAPGVYRLTASGPFLLQSGEAPPRSEARALLSQVFPVKPCPDIAAALWSKLAISASFTSLGAISGLRLRRLAAAPESRRLILAIGREG